MYEVRLGEVRLRLTKRRIQRRMNETTVIACFLSFFFRVLRGRVNQCNEYKSPDGETLNLWRSLIIPLKVSLAELHFLVECKFY